MQNSTDKSKKRVRQETESQSALTKLHRTGGTGSTGGGGGSSGSGASGSGSGSSSSSSSSSSGDTGNVDDSSLVLNKKNNKPSNLRYQGGSSAVSTSISDVATTDEEKILKGTSR